AADARRPSPRRRTDSPRTTVRCRAGRPARTGDAGRARRAAADDGTRDCTEAGGETRARTADVQAPDERRRARAASRGNWTRKRSVRGSPPVSRGKGGVRRLPGATPGAAAFMNHLFAGAFVMSFDKPVRRIAIVGTGVIGASWSAFYLARGFEVVATDPAPN